MKLLVSQFGVDQKHKSSEKEYVSDPVISTDDTLKEWRMVKDVVLIKNYPRHSTPSCGK